MSYNNENTVVNILYVDLYQYYRGVVDRGSKPTSKSPNNPYAYVTEDYKKDRVCIFNGTHTKTKLVRGNHLPNRKYSWYCKECRRHFTSYEYREEAEIAKGIITDLLLSNKERV